MKQQLGQLALVVRDYDEAIGWFTERLGFQLTENTDLGEGKRWVTVRPPGSPCQLLLARATNDQQKQHIGNQTGGRVFLFLYTDNLDRDHQAYVSRGVVFVRPPAVEPFGKVAVFRDLYGNLWDLIQRSED